MRNDVGQLAYVEILVDLDTAQTILGATLNDYRRLPYQELACRIGSVETREVAAPDGTRFQLEIQVFWDAKPGGDVRVLASIDDGRLHAFYPLTQDFIASP